MADNASENIKAFDLDLFKEDTTASFESDYDTDEESPDSNQAEDEPEEEEHEDILWKDIAEVNPDDELELEECVETGYDWSSATFARLGCVAHALQLVIKEALNKNSVAKSLIKIITETINFFHKSNVWTRLLKKKTNFTVLGLGKTRWNTVSIVLERMLQVHTGF